MTEESSKKIEESNSEEIEPIVKKGLVSNLLSKKEISHESLESDHLGIETLAITPDTLFKVVSQLKGEGFNYLQCQGGYDEGPGLNLVSFYHFISIEDYIEKNKKPREVRLKVFLKRDGDLTIPSIYKLFRGADWQERETFDMYGINFEGHPHPKRLLMPEDWKGWPLRKDYVQPDFYEMQDAY